VSSNIATMSGLQWLRYWTHLR